MQADELDEQRRAGKKERSSKTIKKKPTTKQTNKQKTRQKKQQRTKSPDKTKIERQNSRIREVARHQRHLTNSSSQSTGMAAGTLPIKKRQKKKERKKVLHCCQNATIFLAVTVRQRQTEETMGRHQRVDWP